MAETTSGVATVDTPIGTLGVEATIEGITRVRLPGARRPATIPGDPEATAVARNAADQLAEYVRGERTTFELALDWDVVSGEHRRVLEILTALAPYGHTVTYGELGARSGVADARDVGVYMNRNPFPIVVPCHRVVAADGLGGYGGGPALKRRLLELEGALPPAFDLGGL